MTKKQLKVLRKKLPVGYARKIASLTKYKPNTIYKVLSGKRQNLIIIEAAIRLAEANKDAAIDAQQKLNELINK